MLNKCVLFFLALSLSANAKAQTSEQPSLTTDRKFDHFVGVQVNDLIRQVFNFNNTTQNTNNNPYLLTYHINKRKSGWGLRIGLGYNYNTSTSDDGINNTVTDINNFHLRIGVEKAFQLAGKWSAGVGIDGLYNSNNDDTKATTTSFDTIVTETKDVISSYGAGAMGWLRYSFTKNILIGTEASFYYTKGDEKVTVTTADHNLFNPTSNSTTSKNKLGNGNINLPVVFYIIIKFQGK